MITDITQFKCLDVRRQLANVNCYDITLNEVVIKMSPSVTYLGVVVDSELSMASHVERLTVRRFYQLRQLRTIRRSLTTNSAKSFIRAFITSRVDYCNIVFNWMSADNLNSLLQSIINAAIWLVTIK